MPPERMRSAGRCFVLHGTAGGPCLAPIKGEVPAVVIGHAPVVRLAAKGGKAARDSSAAALKSRWGKAPALPMRGQGRTLHHLPSWRDA
jgi:hypothetical protein